jgi:hypothetical protein
MHREERYIGKRYTLEREIHREERYTGKRDSKGRGEIHYRGRQGENPKRKGKIKGRMRGR